MKTELLDASGLSRAAEILRSGGLVAIPTETVYGLGANGLDESAVARIFEVKGRPQDNPLILHVAAAEALSEWCRDIPAEARALTELFWPGPLTLVLKKQPAVPLRVTAGLDTVAVRRVEAILDGGPCRVGVESTILDLSVFPPKVLRPGGVTLEQLRSVLPETELDPGLVKPGETPKAPGMKYRHYSPQAEVRLLRGEKERIYEYVNALPHEGTAVLCFTGEEGCFPGKRALAYGREDAPETLAAGLFDSLRELDTPEVKLICARCPSEEGVGRAVVNRLKKAAGGKITCL